MSTRYNIILKEEANPRKEIILYKHHDGVPEVIVPMLQEMFGKIYDTFTESKVSSWLTSPSKVAGMITHLSVPVITDEMAAALEGMDPISRSFFTKQLMKPIPTIEPDNARYNGCDYEYTITLSEKMEDNKVKYSYTITSSRMVNGKEQFTVSEETYQLGGNRDERRENDRSESEGIGSVVEGEGVGQE